jgi:hypothetical protein
LGGGDRMGRIVNEILEEDMGIENLFVALGEKWPSHCYCVMLFM